MEEGIGEGGTEDLVLEFSMLAAMAGAHLAVCTLEPLAWTHYKTHQQSDRPTDHSQHFVVWKIVFVTLDNCTVQLARSSQVILDKTLYRVTQT